MEQPWRTPMVVEISIKMSIGPDLSKYLGIHRLQYVHILCGDTLGQEQVE